jgi:hypothetical protein
MISTSRKVKEKRKCKRKWDNIKRKSKILRFPFMFIRFPFTFIRFPFTFIRFPFTFIRFHFTFIPFPFMYYSETLIGGKVIEAVASLSVGLPLPSVPLSRNCHHAATMGHWHITASYHTLPTSTWQRNEPVALSSKQHSNL